MTLPDQIREQCTFRRAFRVEGVVARLHLVGQCSIRGPRVGAADRDEPASGKQRESVCHIRHTVVAARVWHEGVSAEGALRDGRVVRAAITVRLRLCPSNEPHEERSHAGHHRFTRCASVAGPAAPMQDGARQRKRAQRLSAFAATARRNSLVSYLPYCTSHGRIVRWSAFPAAFCVAVRAAAGL